MSNTTRREVQAVPVSGILVPPGVWPIMNRRKFYPAKCWRVIVKCCFCNRHHMHGWPDEGDKVDYGGTRLSHCAPGGGTYAIYKAGVYGND